MRIEPEHGREVPARPGRVRTFCSSALGPEDPDTVTVTAGPSRASAGNVKRMPATMARQKETGNA